MFSGSSSEKAAHLARKRPTGEGCYTGRHKKVVTHFLLFQELQFAGKRCDCWESMPSCRPLHVTLVVLSDAQMTLGFRQV